MAIWQFTLNGNPARDADNKPIPLYDDLTGTMPNTCNFAIAEAAAAAQLKTLGNAANGVKVVGGGDGSYNPVTGTYTYTK